MGYVYKITNTVNGKSYIGISIHEPEKDRIKDHLAGRGNRIIARAVKKYGKDAFTYEILEANVFDEFLPDLEMAYIASHNTIAPHGYNLNSGGDHAVPSEQTRRKLSEVSKGRTHTLETRRRISEAQRGKTHSAETRRRISEAHKGKNPKPFSKEHRRKMSEAAKNRSEETRRKVSEALKGKKHSPEHRRNNSESKKGKIKGEKNPFFGKSHSQEARQKMSEAKRHPEYTSVHKFFLSLSVDMALREKRQLIYSKFSSIDKRLIWKWVKKWASTP